MSQSGTLQSRFLGLTPYREARQLQEELVVQRIAGRIPDTILYCEHPPVVTLGKRTQSEHLLVSRQLLTERIGEVVEVTRGGSVTLHLPGQLVIYPVVSLTERKLGVKQFVELGLSAIVAVLSQLKIAAEIRLNPAGVWTKGEATKKLAQVGLQITRGVTNHGFAVNVSCPLAPFSLIAPCGLTAAAVTSIAEELAAAVASGPLQCPEIEVLAELVQCELGGRLSLV